MKYRYLQSLFIDEVSMVGNSMLNFIFNRLQEIKGDYNKPFGGVHVILVGDLFQLRPDMDDWIFKDYKKGYESLGINLWKEFFTMFEHTEIMRQKDDKRFADLLNRVREGKHKDLFIQRFILRYHTQYFS